MASDQVISSNHGSASDPHGHGHDGGLIKLAIGAIGIVYGDIGTSPIYAFRETFAGHHPITPDPFHIFGVLSLIFWSMMIVVTIKYVLIITRADNKGEGGSLALLALINRETEGRRWTAIIVMLGVFATALFYGNSMITPAMSVLSATEGLQTVSPFFNHGRILVITIAILVGLFWLQSRGTAKVGALFGPIMLVYFVTLAVLGVWHMTEMPEVILHTLNPLNALNFFWTDGWRAFIALGSVVLAVTGAEALYADMGHFGRKPIAVSWLWFVLPALMLNYMGQGAMILSSPDANEAIKNLFFLLAPEDFRLPLVILAMMAAIIASQAVITGAFSLTQQAMHMGFVPRMRIEHTSEPGWANLYPGGQLGADGDGHPDRFGISDIIQSGRRLWYRSNGCDDDRHLLAGRRLVRSLEVEMVVRRSATGVVLHRRFCLSRREPA